MKRRTAHSPQTPMAALGPAAAHMPKSYEYQASAAKNEVPMRIVGARKGAWEEA
jgi:hypothetical protein